MNVTFTTFYLLPNPLKQQMHIYARLQIAGVGGSVSFLFGFAGNLQLDFFSSEPHTQGQAKKNGLANLKLIHCKMQKHNIGSVKPWT